MLLTALNFCFQSQLAPLHLGFGDVELLLTKYVTLQVVAFDSLSLESMPYPRYAGSVAGPYTRPLLSSTLAFYVGYTLFLLLLRPHRAKLISSVRG